MPITNHSYLQSFLQYLQFQKRYSPNTILAYQTDLIDFFDYMHTQFDTVAIEEIKPTFVRSWLAQLKEQNLQSKSINRKISTLKSFFKYQLKQQTITASPMSTVVSQKVSKRLPTFIEEKDTTTLFTHVEFTDDWQGKTENLILQLLYNTGMRRAELLELKETQIDAYNNNIKVLGKGNKERLIPVSKPLITLLQNYCQQKREQFKTFDEEVVLVNEKGKKLYAKYVYIVVKKYLTLVTTLTKKSPHVLRHTFATHLMNNGADLNAVKELLGHNSLAATQIYTHNTIDKLKDVHKKAHPKA